MTGDAVPDLETLTAMIELVVELCVFLTTLVLPAGEFEEPVADRVRADGVEPVLDPTPVLGNSVELFALNVPRVRDL